MSVLTQIQQFIAMFRYCWRDARVSVFARVLIVLAPLYFANPFDLIPDWRPGGYIDDFCIVPLLLIAAWIIIPKIVFRDARMSALLSKKAAILGALYVTTASATCQARTVPFSSNLPAVCHSGQRVSSNCGIASKTATQQTVQPEATAAAANDSHQFTAGNNCCGYHPVPSSTAKHLAMAAAVLKSHHLSIESHGPPVLLTTRGGQCQLYASEDASAASLAVKSKYSLEMPSRLAGGIFIGVVTKIWGSGDSSCY